MKKNKKTNKAVEILHRRYIGADAVRKESLQAERVNAEIARTLYDLRNDAGMTQKELAELIGTTQSVISRLEDADYEGHSLSMLNRIAKALNKRVQVLLTSDDAEFEIVRYAFREVVRNLRKSKGLTVEELAKKLDIDQYEIVEMERNNGYRPSPLTLFKLSKFYGVSQLKLAELAGAVATVPKEMREHASRFAAQSNSFSKLTAEERHTLDEFIKILKED